MPTPGKIKHVKRSLEERGRCFRMGHETLSGPVAVQDERFAAVTSNLLEVS